MFARQVRLAREITSFLEKSEDYDLLVRQPDEDPNTYTHMIVLFRARDELVNNELVKRINGTRKMYVSGTKWHGNPACRIAISTWRVDVERDFRLIKSVLKEVLV